MVDVLDFYFPYFLGVIYACKIANGIAMQKGRVGGRIKVRNANSSRILQGKVVDAATVEIE